MNPFCCFIFYVELPMLKLPNALTQHCNTDTRSWTLSSSKTQLLEKNKALVIVQKDQFSRSADSYLLYNLVEWDWSDKDTLRQHIDEQKDSRKKEESTSTAKSQSTIIV